MTWFASLARQGHSFCMECFENYVKSKAFGESKAQVVCMDTSGCTASFSRCKALAVVSWQAAAPLHRSHPPSYPLPGAPAPRLSGELQRALPRATFEKLEQRALEESLAHANLPGLVRCVVMVGHGKPKTRADPGPAAAKRVQKKRSHGGEGRSCRLPIF